MVFAYVALFVGHVHHLQHLLDHRRPAHEGHGHAAGHRRRSPAGAARRCCWSPPLVGLVAGAIGLGARRRGCRSACERLLACRRSRRSRPVATVVAAAHGDHLARRGHDHHRVLGGGSGHPGQPGGSPSPPCATSPIDRSGSSVVRTRRRRRRRPGRCRAVRRRCRRVTARRCHAACWGWVRWPPSSGVFILGPMLARPLVRLLGCAGRRGVRVPRAGWPPRTCAAVRSAPRPRRRRS